MNDVEMATFYYSETLYGRTGVFFGGGVVAPAPADHRMLIIIIIIAVSTWQQ